MYKSVFFFKRNSKDKLETNEFGHLEGVSKAR